MPEVPALIKAAADARASQAPENEEGPAKPVEVHTAFLVIQTRDGQTVLTPDINTVVVIDRPVSRDEAYGMLHTAIKDMEGQEFSELAAASTVKKSVAFNAQVRAAQESAEVQAALEGGNGVPQGLMRGRG